MAYLFNEVDLNLLIRIVILVEVKLGPYDSI